MNDINTCTFSGNVVADAEKAFTNNGTAYCKFTLAVNKKYGETEHTSFFNFTIWGKFAEAVQNFIRKGTPMAIVAEAEQDRWEQDGVKRTAVKFNVSSIRLFSKGKSEEHTAEDHGGSNRQPFESYSRPTSPKSERFEDDIPF